MQKRTNQDYKVAPIQRKEKLNISLNFNLSYNLKNAERNALLMLCIFEQGIIIYNKIYHGKINKNQCKYSLSDNTKIYMQNDGFETL